METTHVFIVDTTTFKIHLEYLFAGTGAKDHFIDFNGRPETQLNYATENNLVGMISDSQRIRQGDSIIFYLQQDSAHGVYDGKFYGIFAAQEDLSFLDNNDSNQFLFSSLNKSLTFRTVVTPRQVYQKGVTEWEALDEIKYLQSPNQMLWSLIYRKLKGNRGNTMITVYESERLFKLIRDKNSRRTIEGVNLTFNIDSQEIEPGQTTHRYTGRRERIDVLPRLLRKYSENKAFEAHLQAYVVQNIGRNTNTSLDRTILNGLPIEWIGNEVSCGVGMQRIDVMLSLINGKQRLVVPIELKAVEASPDNTIQVQRYIDWLQQYYIPNRVSDIQPVLISEKYINKDSSDYRKMLSVFREFNKRNHPCLPLRYIEFEPSAKSLVFGEVAY